MTAAPGVLRLAVGQAEWDPDETNVLRSATELVERAARDGARVLLLSELHLFGYDMAAYSDPGRAVDPDDSRLAELSRACVRTGVDLFVGAATTGAPDGRLWNAILRIAADGSVTTAHRKVHLWSSERAVFARGHAATLVEVDGVRIGLGVCYDAGFPEYVRALVDAGADVVLFASAFARGDEERRYDVYHVARALESGVWVAVANALGQVGDQSFFGRGAVIDPMGRLEAELGPDTGVITVDVDPARVDEARRALPYLRDRLDAYPVAASSCHS